MPDEIIVADDGSNKETASLIKKFSKEFIGKSKNAITSLEKGFYFTNNKNLSKLTYKGTTVTCEKLGGYFIDIKTNVNISDINDFVYDKEFSVDYINSLNIDYDKQYYDTNNEKEKYYYKKARSAGVEFKCSTKGCNQILSRFTTDTVCEVCQAKKRSADRQEILDMLNGK